MADLVGSMIWRVAIAACLLFAFVAGAAAQASEPAPAGATPDFLPRYTFHLAASKLNIDDQRFDWDTHFGGDLDVLDYGLGRVNLLADYEAVLGTEFRPFDPNQGNYTLEASSSLRVAGLEFEGAFYHQSRHLGDRPKRESVAWNAVLARVLTRVQRSDWRIDAEASAGPVIKHNFVDYVWTADADVRMERTVSPRVGVFARGVLQIYGVDPAIAGRGTQSGGRFEGGVRLAGRAGDVELFAGVEQRVDAYPLDRVPQRWALAGFRLNGGTPR